VKTASIQQALTISKSHHSNI